MTIALILSSFFVSQDAANPTQVVMDAIREGRAGERYDGYLDFVGTPDETLRRSVGAINIRRRALYIDLGERRRIAPREVGIATACKLFLRVPEGGAYQLADGEWRTRSIETPLLVPDYCPNAER